MSIYTYYFLGNYTGFTVRGYIQIFEMVLKSFVFAHSRFLFLRPSRIAVKVHIDEDYWRISGMVATVESIILARSSVFAYALKSRVRWVRFRS